MTTLIDYHLMIALVVILALNLHVSGQQVFVRVTSYMLRCPQHKMCGNQSALKLGSLVHLDYALRKRVVGCNHRETQQEAPMKD